MEEVILVDTKDREIGRMEKMEAHEKGRLHRAISVFVFNDEGKLLLQQRADSKYHSGGLWTNTCCTHPRPNEEVEEAAHRRLMEEMGVDCELERSFSFIYEAKLDNGLTEHELDHVFIGRKNLIPSPNPQEVKSWKYVSVSDIHTQVEQNPTAFTAWFKIVYARVCKELSL